MNWMYLSDQEVMEIATPIMDNLMQASTDVNHAQHIKDFSDHMKAIVTKENLEKQCVAYQSELGFFAKRELVGIFKKADDVRILWRQFYTKSKNEFIAFLYLKEIDGAIKVINVSVS